MQQYNLDNGLVVMPYFVTKLGQCSSLTYLSLHWVCFWVNGSDIPKKGDNAMFRGHTPIKAFNLRQRLFMKGRGVVESFFGGHMFDSQIQPHRLI